MPSELTHTETKHILRSFKLQTRSWIADDKFSFLFFFPRAPKSLTYTYAAICAAASARKTHASSQRTKWPSTTEHLSIWSLIQVPWTCIASWVRRVFAKSAFCVQSYYIQLASARMGSVPYATPASRNNHALCLEGIPYCIVSVSRKLSLRHFDSQSHCWKDTMLRQRML